MYDEVIHLQKKGGGSGGVTKDNVVSMYDIGSIKAGDTIPAGSDIDDLVRQVFLGVFYPTYTPPSFVLNSNQANGQEIGKTVELVLTLVFNRGSINGNMVDGVWVPNTKQNDRAGEATKYIIEQEDKGLVNTHTINPYVLLANQTFNGSVDYAKGPQPIDSDGNNYGSMLAAGTGGDSTTITAIYPYFWGKTNADLRPQRNQALINSGTKVVNNSSGTITINFNSSSDDWLRFAIPATSANKTKWYMNALNNGNIGGSSDLFDGPSTVNIDSPDLYWNEIPYKIYVSTYRTDTSGSMELRNS